MEFSKNKENEYCCPVTYKVFTGNMKIAAIATSGQVYAYGAIEELNVKRKNWTVWIYDVCAFLKKGM